MKSRWLIVVVAGLLAWAFCAPGRRSGLGARSRHHKARAALHRSRGAVFLGAAFFGIAGPQPNGCAPPVFEYGHYIGQDPDPNIRFQLMREPDTGYTAYYP